MNNLRKICLVAGTQLLLMLLCFNSSVDAQHAGKTFGKNPFSTMYAFGDSLTDTGNLYRDTFMQVPPPSLGYFEGRASNGPIWIDYLAFAMNLDLEPANNYAYAGATTGRENVNDGYYGLDNLPGLHDQIDSFEEDLNGQPADKYALYIVWAGANDFNFPGINPFQAIFEGVGNTRNAVRRLRQLGARRIMVVNLPDLGLIPTFNTDPQTSQDMSLISSFYNLVLKLTLTWEEIRGVKTIRVDVAKVIRAASNAPEEFDFSNVTDGWLYSPMLQHPSRFLFWDLFHPTTHGHGFIAEEALNALQQKFPYLIGS